MARRLLVVLLVLVALVAGVFWGGHPSALPGFARKHLVADNDQIALVQEALGVIGDDYYKPIDKTALVNKGLEGAVASLHDRFSHYFDPKTYAQFSRQNSGQFAGIGVEVRQDKRGLRVARVLPKSPASRGGLAKGDVITAVDGRSIAGQDDQVSTGRIRGEPGTSVSLLILHAGGKRRVRLERAEVPLQIVTSRTLHAGGRRYGYVRLASFTSGAHGLVGQRVRGALAKGAKGIVFDLRSNGGGLLEEAVLTASIFLPNGKVVSTRGRSRGTRTYDVEGGAIPASVPVVVLMDRGTASASEIVAGALQDRHRAKLIGSRSFGKGVFQEVQPLSNGGALDITVGQYFLPSGRNLGGRGVAEGSGLKPDVPVKVGAKPKGDPVLRAALRTLERER